MDKYRQVCTYIHYIYIYLPQVIKGHSDAVRIYISIINTYTHSDTVSSVHPVGNATLFQFTPEFFQLKRQLLFFFKFTKFFNRPKFNLTHLLFPVV